MVNSSLSQGRLSHLGQMLRLVCPDGHTSCCIYALLKALLRLLSYEKKNRCPETGVEAKPQRTCQAWQHCPELSPWPGVPKVHTQSLQSYEGQMVCLARKGHNDFPSATLPLVAFSGREVTCSPDCVSSFGTSPEGYLQTVG